MIRRPPRSTRDLSSAASDVYKRQGQGDAPPDDYRGVIVLQVDGLSYYHLQDALARGYMPNIARMIDEDGYVLSRTDCGLSSQTSACQAGIFYGDNYDCLL